jgi:hypothetical protein
MGTAEDLQNLQDQITELDTKLSKLSADMDSLDKSTSSFNKNLGDTNNLLGDAVSSTVAIQKNFREFALDTQAQYKYAEKLATQSKKTAVNIGLSVGRSHEFTKSFNKATAQVQKFGMEASDVNRIMTEYAETSGRARILTPDEVLNIGLMEKGLGLGAESASKMMERMELMGMNAKDANRSIGEMVKSSQSLGLNASKVAKTLSNNFGQMSNMSFQNGVKGMTNMAKLAVQMRMDVGDMLGMADKFYQPEAAIEAAANLQMLGGDIANAFGDPFETMYLARNKPEELAEKVKVMTENMMTFNEETGQYEFPAEARMQLQAAGKQLGINVDSMMDIARQSSKIKDIKMKVSSNIVDEDMREGLASLARLDESGNWVIDMAQGDPIQLEDVGMEDAAAIMAAPKDADEAIMDMANNSMTTNELLKNIDKSLQTGFVAENNVYEITEDVLRPSMLGLFTGVETQVGNMVKAIKESPVGDFQKNMTEQAKGLGIASAEGLSTFFEGNFAENIGAALTEAGSLLAESFSTDLTKILKERAKTGEGDKDRSGVDPSDTDPDTEDDFLLRNDGTKVSFSSEDDVVGAKRGGPLDKLMNKGLGGESGNGASSEMKVSGTATINVNINSNTAISANMESQLTSKIIEVYQKISNGDGDPSSVFQAQPSKGSDILYT